MGDVKENSGKIAFWKNLFLRGVGFGAGFAVTLLLAVASYGWWSSRPKQWSNTAVTAKPTELSFQRQREEIRFRFRYALTNNTDIEYILATPSSAALMRKLPEDSSLAKVAATWDDNVRIPFTVINNELSDALLGIVSSADQSEQLRAAAAISLGPVLEQARLCVRAPTAQAGC